ncbi:ferritin heavy chain-like [Cochliomyia hominivorax]
MMKYITIFYVLTTMSISVLSDMQCASRDAEIPHEWIDLRTDCLSSLRQQIQKQIDVSYHFLAMGAHFSRDTINRPGFADMFFYFARTEREQASQLTKLISKRGQLTDNISELIKVPTLSKDSWENGAEALEDAIKIKTDLTKSIRKVIATCERRYNYYQIVKSLISDFMVQQLYDQRNLAGKLSKLKQLMVNHSGVGEFLYDKKLYDELHF